MGLRAGTKRGEERGPSANPDPLSAPQTGRRRRQSHSFFFCGGEGRGEPGKKKGFLLFAIVNRITKNGSRKKEGGRKKRNGFGRRSEEEEKGDKH